MKASRRTTGYTLLEVICATAVITIVMAAAMAGVVTLQKSFAESKRYATLMNDGSRLIDYIGRDLRNATRVSRVDSGVATPLKPDPVTPSNAKIEITNTTQLALSLPDYYLSNVPDNSVGSDYKKGRYSRSQLPMGQNYFTYTSVVEVTGSTRAPRYPGTIEVRYLKKARSGSDPTLCYFRQEFSGGVMRLEQEVAQRAEDETLSVAAIKPKTFQLISSFVPKWSRVGNTAGTQQYATVQMLNQRRD